MWAEYLTHMKMKKLHEEIQGGNLKERNHVEDMGLKERINIKRVFILRDKPTKIHQKYFKKNTYY